MGYFMGCTRCTLWRTKLHRTDKGISQLATFEYRRVTNGSLYNNRKVTNHMDATDNRTVDPSS